MIRGGFLTAEERQDLTDWLGTGWLSIVWPGGRTRWCCWIAG